MLIGFCGKMGSGKTTAARLMQLVLQRSGIVAPVCSFATPIKKATEAKYGRKGTREENQRMGDEMRAADPDIIVRMAIEYAKEEAINGIAIFDDVRKRAEFDAIARDGYVIRIVIPNTEDRKFRLLNRDGAIPPDSAFQHNTETELDSVPAYIGVKNGNDVCLDNLRHEMYKALLLFGVFDKKEGINEASDVQKH